MTCELCHRAEAEAAIQQTVDGEVREFYVCQACADQRRATAQPSADIVIEILIGSVLGTSPEVQPSKRPGKQPPCPRCGMTNQEFHRRSRLGCSTCYSHFAQELAPLLRDMHLGLRHVGKIPCQAADQAARERLQAELSEAIAGQQYEHAAILRDRLRALAGPTPPPEQPREGGHA